MLRLDKVIQEKSLLQLRLYSDIKILTLYQLTDIIQDLMQYLFDACFEMKSRLASQYVAILDDIFNQIAKTRAEALKRIGRVKHMDLASTADERLKIINVKVGPQRFGGV